MAAAIEEARWALRQRHLVEEAAHAPAIDALAVALKSQGAGLQEKVQDLQDELVQCYRAQAQVSEQLLEEVAAVKTMRVELSQKTEALECYQADLLSNREEASRLQATLDEKLSELELITPENQELRKQVEKLEAQSRVLEEENKMLIDRWMSQKMQDAERLNEANAMYEDLLARVKAGRLEELARQQVDGIVRYSESGAEDYVEMRNPTKLRHTLQGHDRGCTAAIFQHNSDFLVSGGNDKLVKLWNTKSGSTISSLSGCLSSVLDLALPADNKFVLGAGGDHKLYYWEISSGRIRHCLTGHTEKVCSVDISKVSNNIAISGAHDRTMKFWDLQKGYATRTVICHSNCNALCFTSDASMFCSGHIDGTLRFWDARMGKLANEIAAHGQVITSVSISRSGRMVLTSGRDNQHNLFDVRSMEICASLKAQGHRVSSNWTRSCISADETYVAAGSENGSVVVWNTKNCLVESTLSGHAGSVLACAWSDLGKPLASADRFGNIHLWQ
ncbi:hypothetical protein GOP47_0021914 [Adiantum capillus-veneris]|uniref:Autophagy-related protein 16 domain-containing protein n=1 Tax=Adiantum capillus-veneris TaxID=13818 RepID=A0A9D4Z7D4_ADICA|nr:hypothetical protein GOP47_0021914 [Adiantum capillus-veneris]